MKRNTLLKVINPIFAILFVNQILTGIMAGSLPREAFVILHAQGGILLALVALTHVILNWNWIKATYFHKSGAVSK